MKRSIRVGILGLLLFGFILAGCQGEVVAEETPTEPAIRPVTLAMPFIPNVQFAPFYAAVELDYYKKALVEVTFNYSFETDSVALVASGELDFALVSGEQVLLARAQGLPVVYVMAWYQDYPVAVVSTAEAGIEEPADLAGKRIGLPGLYGANYVGLQALLFSVGLTDNDVTLEAIGFNQVEAIATEQQEIIVGYAANEPVQLAARGYEINVMRVSDHVSLASNGVLTSEAMLQPTPALVRAFIRATLKGVQYAVEYPEETFRLCKRHVENLGVAEEAVQMEVLLTSIEFWRTDRLGYSPPKAWENMHAVLLQMGLLAEPLDLEAAFTNLYLP